MISDRPRGIPESLWCPRLEPVPTAEELATQGLAARIIVKGQGVFYRISKDGQAMIDAAINRNVATWMAWRESREARP